MQIFIDKLSIRGLGPIANIKWDFKDINLIYGKNEQGKTFIVEFLLNSLFHNTTKTRKLHGSGQVKVSGLGEIGVRFDPKSRTKIENYLFTDDIPVDLSRLLVVKAGLSRFSPDIKEGINKSILKDYLSDQRLLDSIMDRIPVNIQRSSWENGRLIPSMRTGECRIYSEYLKKRKMADDLLAEVDEKYSLGEITKARIQLFELEGLIEKQENARRYLAFQKSLKINELDQALAKLPKRNLEDIKTAHFKLQGLQRQITKDQNELSDLQPQCTHYQWLETAINQCEKRPNALRIESDLHYVVPMILLITGAVVFSFLQISWGSLISGSLAILLLILTVRHYRSRLAYSDELAEVNRIFQDYETKFNQQARTITDLKTKFDQIQPKFFGLQKIREQLKDNQDELSILKEELLSQLFTLIGKKADIENVNLIIEELQAKRDSLEKESENEKLYLAGLGINPNEYLSNPSATMFDRDRLIEYKEQKEKLLNLIQEKENNLNILKQRVCDLTNMKISSSWDILIDSLKDHRDEVSQSIKEVKAKIGSGVIVSDVISEIRKREDASISKSLASKEICEPITTLTHNYQGVELAGDEIIIYSDFERFPVRDLSTGAQEQVLLALRIGIASHFLKNQKMFLILDDAFQHSDWQRREWMVDQMADLASIGWQIIYFAMDDHIKQLFEERIKPKFPDRYAGFELNN